jgi:hypothetical protein
MAVKRKSIISIFCKNMQYVSMDSMSKILEIFFEQKVGDRLTYSQFIKFIRVDDTAESKAVFDVVLGEQGSKKKTPTIDSKVFIIYILGTIENVERE